MRSRLSRAAAFSLTFLMVFSLVAVRVFGDEGMFLPDAINRLDQLKKRGLEIPISEIYNPNGVSIKDAVVIVDGGTGEFVSPEGLLLTNHHVAFDALVAASDQAKDYGTTGYTARSRPEELPAKNYTVTITQELKEVTSEVLGGINETTPAEQRNSAIQSKIRSMEAAGSRQTDGVQMHVLPMNEGLFYYQVTYLVLRDVRIVYAPPKSIGFFGGDPDNFEYPRYDLDICLFRVYENGHPAKIEHFLKFNSNGPNDRELIFVSGSPGKTDRQLTLAELADMRDRYLPYVLNMFYRREVLESAYSARSF